MQCLEGDEVGKLRTNCKQLQQCTLNITVIYDEMAINCFTVPFP